MFRTTEINSVKRVGSCGNTTAYFFWYKNVMKITYQRDYKPSYLTDDLINACETEPDNPMGMLFVNNYNEVSFNRITRPYKGQERNPWIKISGKNCQFIDAKTLATLRTVGCEFKEELKDLSLPTTKKYIEEISTKPARLFLSTCQIETIYQYEDCATMYKNWKEDGKVIIKMDNDFALDDNLLIDDTVPLIAPHSSFAIYLNQPVAYKQHTITMIIFERGNIHLMSTFDGRALIMGRIIERFDTQPFINWADARLWSLEFDNIIPKLITGLLYELARPHPQQAKIATSCAVYEPKNTAFSRTEPQILNYRVDPVISKTPVIKYNPIDKRKYILAQTNRRSYTTKSGTVVKEGVVNRWFSPDTLRARIELILPLNLSQPP